MSTTSLELSKQFSSFSGTDIRVVVNGTSIATIQALSYAVQREKGPVFVMGSPDALSFSRGKRAIAGTQITLMLDKHVLYQEPFLSMKFVAPNDQIAPNNQNIQDFSNAADLDEGTVFSATDISGNYSLKSAWYFDQLPPMDYVIIGANEYGNAATMRVYGAEYMNEGSGFSVDDMVIENQTTYIARHVLPWQPLGSWNYDSGLFEPVA